MQPNLGTSFRVLSRTEMMRFDSPVFRAVRVLAIRCAKSFLSRSIEKKSRELAPLDLIARLLASFVLTKVNFPTFAWAFRSKNLEIIEK